MQITRNTLETGAGPADWFTGTVYIDTIAAPDRRLAPSAPPPCTSRPARAPPGTRIRSARRSGSPRASASASAKAARSRSSAPATASSSSPARTTGTAPRRHRFMTHIAMQQADDDGSAVDLGRARHRRAVRARRRRHEERRPPDARDHDVRRRRRPRRERARPAIVEPTDAVIRVVRACICGSDLWPYNDMPQSETGQSMGHEAIGVVEDDRQRRAARSSRARSSSCRSRISDGTCEFCHEGLPTACVHVGFFGNDGMNGAQAEALRIPYADGTLVPRSTSARTTR